MKLTELFIGQLEREMPLSRRMLERVPEGRPEWKPHEKSMPLGYLATLVATMPGWIAMTIRQDSMDIAPKGGAGLSASRVEDGPGPGSEPRSGSGPGPRSACRHHR